MSNNVLTHANWSATDTPEFHQQFDQAVAAEFATGDQQIPLLIGGTWHVDRELRGHVSSGDWEKRIGWVALATPEDVIAAVDAAARAYPQWRRTPVQTRAKLLTSVADAIYERRFDIAAALSVEIGKNRFEAMTEVQEAIELLRFYTARSVEEAGFVVGYPPLGTEHSRTVLRPYGVWPILGPFNFPFALSAGMAAAAVLMGNTVVLKSPDQAPKAVAKLAEIFTDVGMPEGVVNLLAGGADVGIGLTANDKVAGVGFTGSMNVGLSIRRALDGKPVVAEMGGKNAAIVMSTADVEIAAEAVARSAFRYSGQKCSACSKVLVHRSLIDDFADRVFEIARGMAVGVPWEKGTVVGPLITESARKRVEQAFAEAETAARRFLITDAPQAGADGAYSRFGIAVDLPEGHRLLSDELFAPMLTMQSVDGIDEAIQQANDTPYGLTSGLYSADQAEIDRFLDEIEVGVCYVNRVSGATTGAWVGHQSFGGWKGSGTTGANAHGAYYLHQFAREQSRTISGEEE